MFLSQSGTLCTRRPQKIVPHGFQQRIILNRHEMKTEAY